MLRSCLLQTDDFSSIQKAYKNLSLMRQALVQPVTLTDEQYIAQWQKITWQGKPFAEDAIKYFTVREECVRSKSEVLIADALLRHGVAYRYEYPLKLRCGKQTGHRGTEITVYPDFLCLNVRTREEFFWEHFGMMDDADYAGKATAKMNLYAENGVFPGRNLIITMETQNEPLNTRTVEKLIKEFLI